MKKLLILLLLSLLSLPAMASDSYLFSEKPQGGPMQFGTETDYGDGNYHRFYHDGRTTYGWRDNSTQRFNQQRQQRPSAARRHSRQFELGHY